jgi:6-phosphogluconolactonase (cycloisomerase 2 family)
MGTVQRTGVAACVALCVAAWGAPFAAGAQSPIPVGGASGAARAVFVQTDNTSGNKIVAFVRANNGTLTLSATYATGGLGGVLNGSVVDHLASADSLTYDKTHSLLYAVNAGSNTVTVFSVNGDKLTRRQTISSGGTFPVSVAVAGDLVYVLNALGGGSVTGFTVNEGKLEEISGSTRPLHLTIPTGNTQYTLTPGQVAFTPGGTQLIVTTKVNGSDIDIFAVVGEKGRISRTPVVNSEPGTYPFESIFDSKGHLVISDLGTAALSTYTDNSSGRVTPVDTLGTGKIDTCWVSSARGYFYASNPGSASLSTFMISSSGQLTLDGTTTTDGGTVDSSATPNGQFLYVQTGLNGVVDEFHVAANGRLNEVGSVTVAGSVGGEGIAAF